MNITLVEALDHVLSMYDAKISQFTESHFAREHINVLNNTFVKAVEQKEVLIQKKVRDSPVFYSFCVSLLSLCTSPPRLAQPFLGFLSG